ncbi:MAG TPA: peptidoglycan DD-metalloendopeptidase family protein [Thermoleophilaceae bacterium]|nr:peptidoglycan DD-metalloendopeptidase family protein [Thermoleophilaceae bacterium]
MPRTLFLIPFLLALAAYVLLPLPGSSAPLSQRIESKRGQVEAKKGREGVLSTTIQRYNTNISSLQGEINSTESRLTQVQSELDEARAQLEKVRDDLEVARDQLAKARAKLKASRAALADRLVELYKADQPDALTVVLEADGFADLLERTEFLERISERDGEIVTEVRILKARAEKAERLLDELEHVKATAAGTILERRDDIAAARDRLASAQGELRTARDGRRTALAQVRNSRQSAQEDLAALEREQARVTAQLRNTSGGAPAGPVRRGSGQLIWPINGTLSSPFGQRWGRLHAGLDISAPEGTPIRAADSGRVVLAAYTGGYGNYTCIQHAGSMSTCYAHQSRLGTSAGASVSQGQVMGYVGNTGNSFGAHLHFEVRLNGSPVDPLGYL